MADGDDPFASIIDDCLYSSSQEEILRNTKFAREEEVFDGEDGKPPGMVGSGLHRTEFDGEDVEGGSIQVEFTGVSADSDENKVLGFLGQTKKSPIEVAFDGKVRLSEVQEAESDLGRVIERESGEEGSSIEPLLKKSRISGSKLKGENFSPLVQCSEKIVIDGEDKYKQIVVYKRFEIVRPLRCFSPDGVEFTEELVFDDDEMGGEKSNAAKRKLEFEDDTEKIEVEDDETIEPNKNKETGSDVDRGDDNGKGDENQKDRSSEEIGTSGKRVLPHSWRGQIGGLNTDGIAGIGNDGVGTYNKEQCEISTEENGGQKSKIDENLRRLLDMLKVLATQRASDADDHEIDIFETAKRRGMTFPRNRFLVDIEKDE